MNVGSTKKKNKDIPSDEKAALIAEFADDMKAERIETLFVGDKTSVTSYFVICTGTSDTHARAIGDKVTERMREAGHKPLRKNVIKNADGWILLDFGDVVFHIFLEEKRQFYDLETLWTSMESDPNLIRET